MTLQGKGFFINNLLECEGGDPAAIVPAAQAAGLSHVLVKIAEGERAFGFDSSGSDFTAPVVQALHAAGIAVWGWHSVLGNKPMAEATIAIERTQSLGLDGYVVDAEAEYSHPGMAGAARQFMRAVRAALQVPIALSSYCFPNFHPELPWSSLLEFCDLHMPKVTWEGAHNAGEQLLESRHQCDALPNAKPCIPTGAAYTRPGWSPTGEEINDFMNTAKALGLPAVNFFNWDQCRKDLPLVWETIAKYNWPVESQSNPPATTASAPPETFLSQFLAALNSRQAAQAGALYDLDAIQVWADRTLTGAAAIQAGYAAFFDSLPADAAFTISDSREEDDWVQFSWKAGLLSGETTLVMKNGKIILDYTFVE